MARKGHIAAAVDIGSNAIRMLIAQDRGGCADELEWLESPLNLGHETFTHGGIRFATLARAVEVLRGYYLLADEYDIPSEYIRTVATTALREASNQAYIADQLRIRTGHDVTVLEDGQEKSMLFRETLRRIGGTPELEAGAFLMAYIGTGSLGLALCETGRITYAQNIGVGSVKLTEMMDSLSSHSGSLGTVLEEYLHALTHVIGDSMRATPMEGFVVVGKEIDMIADLCGIAAPRRERDILRISRERLSELCLRIGDMTPAQLTGAFGLGEEQADSVLPTLIIYRTLMDFTSAQEALCPQVMLTDAVMRDLLFTKESKQFRKQFEDSIVASARRMAAQYDNDRPHSDAVERYALDIFDCLRPVHGFTRRERLYLQTAAILHDIGKFVASADHHRITAHVVMDSSLIDLSRQEMTLLAQIARYHSDEVPDRADPEYNRLAADDQLVVAKLSAILRLADALDRSHRQKLSDVSMRLDEGRLTVVGRSLSNTLLEEWTFAGKAEYFGEVFGLKCELRVKGLI